MTDKEQFLVWAEGVIREYHELGEQYDAITDAYEQQVAPILLRKRKIVQELTGYVTYRDAGQMLGISAPRVGQLVQEARKHDERNPPATGPEQA